MMTTPLVGIVMGSASDWPVMLHAANRLAAFGVPCESRVISAHRSPAPPPPSPLRWLWGSKARRLSSSSPKNSRRAGAASAGLHRSRMPPRVWL